MSEPTRKPLVHMSAESKVARAIRLHPQFEEQLREEARIEGLGWTTLARECLIDGLSMRIARRAVNNHTRVTA